MDSIGGGTTGLLAVSLVVIALGVATGGLGGAGQASGGVLGTPEEPATLTQTTQPQGPIPQVDIDADVILMKAAVDSAGTADWRVTYQLELQDDADTDAFEQLWDDIRSNRSTYLDPFEERMSRTVQAAETATNREMRATNYTVTAARESQPQAEFGVVTFRLEWGSFASVEDETMRVGDAIDSLFLNEGESLELRWPAEYGTESSTPSPTISEEQRAVWRGPVDFDTGEPRLVLATSQGGSDSGDGGLSVLPLAGVVGLVLAVTAVVFFVRRDSEVEETAEPDTAADSEEPAAPSPELLSNEERVLRLLKQNGGRMKQKAVAEQLDWTDAKTSQVVGTLREDDEVEAFRLGRENVLTLPDVDIEGNATGDGDSDDRPGRGAN
jgi:uncharacterized membrane protein